MGPLQSGHLGSVFSCPDDRGVLISRVMYFGLKLMGIMNYRGYAQCRGVTLQPYWVAKRHVAYREQYEICLVEEF